MQLFGTDLLKTYWAHDVGMTSMRRRYVASTSLRRHVPAGNLPPLPPPPPNILNLPTPMINKFRGSTSIEYLETRKKCSDSLKVETYEGGFPTANALPTEYCDKLALLDRYQFSDFLLKYICTDIEGSYRSVFKIRLSSFYSV